MITVKLSFIETNLWLDKEGSEFRSRSICEFKKLANESKDIYKIVDDLGDLLYWVYPDKGV
jgi:hypothetical protein